MKLPSLRSVVINVGMDAAASFTQKLYELQAKLYTEVGFSTSFHVKRKLFLGTWPNSCFLRSKSFKLPKYEVQEKKLYF